MPKPVGCWPHPGHFEVMISNRPVEEWVALFDDPILANSALSFVW